MRSTAAKWRTPVVSSVDAVILRFTAETTATKCHVICCQKLVKSIDVCPYEVLSAIGTFNDKKLSHRLETGRQLCVSL